MDLFLIILRIVHIFGAIYWVGSGFFLAFIFEPVLRKASDPERAILTRVTGSRTWETSVAAAGMLTVLAGLILFFRYWANSGDAWNSNAVRVFGIGGLAGIGTMIIGAAFVGKASDKLTELGKQAAGGSISQALHDEMAATEAKLTQWSRIDLVFMLVAVFCMAIARHVG